MFKTQGGFECDFQVGFWLWMQSAWSACVWSACVLPVVVKSLLNEYYLPFTPFDLKIYHPTNKWWKLRENKEE